ncbi:general stress protein [Sporosarcina siberiensis]|uniref:General stress protein n=1 Tax=Sporosarcina siberiensis TaxID=1365606 RepID=A0ABW4SGW6_9BACL
MEKRQYVGTYHSIDSVLNKVTELLAQGYLESDLFAVSREQDNLSMLHGQTGIDLIGGHGATWIERFKVYVSGDEPVLKALVQMGFSEKEAEIYFDEVRNGGIALFIDEALGKQNEGMDSSREPDRSGQEMEDIHLNEESDGVTPRINTQNL